MENITTPKVLIASCINERKDYCMDEFMEYVLHLKYPNKQYFFVDNSRNKDYHKKLIQKYGVEISYVDPTEKTNVEYMCISMNRIVKKLLQSNCDYVFNNECDVFATDDVIPQLMAHNKMITSASYLQSEGWKAKLCEQRFENSFGTRTNRNVEWNESFKEFNGKLQKVDTAGIGVILIHRLILENYLFRINAAYPKTHSDTFFFQDMNELGISIYRDNSLMCNHKNSNWKNFVTE